MSGPSSIDYRPLLEQAYQAIEDLQAKLDERERDHGREPAEPVAIIGMACRFPGGGNDPESFWRLLEEGVDAISEVPADRWDAAALYDPAGGPGKMSTRWGGFLEGVDQFDAGFFGIAPREAARMDPQQRLWLEVAWEALESAGQTAERLAGSKTAVFAGICSSDYGRMEMAGCEGVDAYDGAGGAYSMVANRLSYLLDLQGPSMAVDTACSSSLVAVHLACQSLRNRECELAVAGGVNLILSPQNTVSLSAAGMLAPDGRCKTFDAAADGTVRSEGCGAVILKRLPDALAAGDPILAVIRGWAINQDGRSNGLTAPNVLAQENVLRQALANAGLAPEQITYLEAHGTGTSLGDPIEVEALSAVYGQPRRAGEWCAIGSVKTNVGHLEAAAGMAALIKTVLAMQHGAIPRHLHFQRLNPNISLEGTPFVIPASLLPWPARIGQRRYAGVSSFGFGGTNAHVVLEEAPAQPERVAAGHRTCLLPLSARSPEALKALVGQTIGFCRLSPSNSLQRPIGNRPRVDNPPHIAESTSVSGLGGADPLVPNRPPGRLLREHIAQETYDLCYTAGVRRSHHAHRLAVVGSTSTELADRLSDFEYTPRDQRGKLVFVFSGQGVQWAGMGRELLDREPVFRGVVEECENYLRPYTGWSLVEELLADADRSRLEETAVAQPALVAIQVALAALLRWWGIEPEAVAGHSIGEVAAAHVAGVLSLADAMRLAYLRGQLMQRTHGQGAMAAVGLGEHQVREVLNGHQERVAIAAVNAPESTVLSGDPSALAAVLDTLERQGVRRRRLEMPYAFHSPQMAGLQEELVQALNWLQPQRAELPIASTLTGRLHEGNGFDASYWGRQMQAPVRFAAAIETLARDGDCVFLEIGPHPALSSAMRDCLAAWGRSDAIVPTLRKGRAEDAALLHTLGELYTRGFPVAWSHLYAEPGSRVPLPAYPWQRQRYWFEESRGLPPVGRTSRSAPGLLAQHFAGTDGGGAGTPRADQEVRPTFRMDARAADLHPLLQRRLSSASRDVQFESDLSIQALPYLADHCVDGRVVFPLAAFLEMALAAAGTASGIEDVVVERALLLPKDQVRTLQVILEPDNGFQIFSLAGERKGERNRERWTRHVTGRVRSIPLADARGSEAPILNRGRQRAGDENVVKLEVGRRIGFCRLAPPAGLDPSATDHTRQWSVPQAVSEHYKRLRGQGLEYGPSFHAITELRQHEDQAWGRIQLPAGLDATAYRIHPAMLDACFQVLGAALPATEMYLPIAVESFRCYRPAGNELWCQASLRSLLGDITLFDAAGEVMAEIRGLRLRKTSREAFRSALGESQPDWLYEVAWRPLPEVSPKRALGGRWLIYMDTGGVAAALAKLLEAEGASCVLVSSEDQPFPQAFGPFDGVVHLGSGCRSVLALVQALARTGWAKMPQLWLVTRGAQGVESAPVSPEQAPLWGLGRVLAQEHPELRCTCVDLDPDGEAAGWLRTELQAGDEEDQVAWRKGQRYGARLVRAGRPALVQAAEADQEVGCGPGGPPYPVRLTTGASGVLDHLSLRPATRRSPGPGEVELRVHATGLNFRDVLNALGMYPGEPKPLGGECAGTIVAVGAGVRGLAPGDAVVALAPASFATYITTNATFVLKKPNELSFATAAGLPVAYLTAAYGLKHLADLKPGQRVLIHSAAGGVGLAAVQIAQRIGAEIFATAGSPEKRGYLRSLGVEHVFDSRSLAFADEVRDMDVVLNSLSGKFLTASLGLVRAGGCFVELGKPKPGEPAVQIPAGMRYAAFDLGDVCDAQPALVMEMLGEVLEGVAAQTLRPLPVRSFPLEQATNAFRFMAQSKHIGKLVLTQTEAGEPLAADGAYLITGGLGGLGIVLARWMVAQGARHLALMGRSGPSEAAQRAMEEMRSAGAAVAAVQGDVSDEDQVARVLGEIAKTSWPLRGIVHAAGVLDDSIVLQQTWDRFERVLAPKVQGAWNLHHLTQNLSLDFFVMFSSAAALLGSPGQASYAAGNAFLDALAQVRQAHGQAAVSLNWGPWADTGMATAQDRQTRDRWDAAGITSLTLQKGLEIFSQTFRSESAQVAVLPIDWTKWAKHCSGTRVPPLFAEMFSEPFREEKVTHEKPPDLQTYVREQALKVMGLPATHRLNPRQSLQDLGLDSLMAVEMRNALSMGLRRSLPATLLFDYPTIESLVDFLSPKEIADAGTADGEQLDKVAATLERLSENEAEALLRQHLEKL